MHIMQAYYACIAVVNFCPAKYHDLNRERHSGAKAPETVAVSVHLAPSLAGCSRVAARACRRHTRTDDGLEGSRCFTWQWNWRCANLRGEPTGRCSGADDC